MRVAKGDVLIVDFPYSDLSGSKLRPALVVALTPGRDVILCQMTSRSRSDRDAVSITPADVPSGKLSGPGLVRTNHLFTADRKLLRGNIGSVSAFKMREITDAIVAVLRR